MLATVPSSIVRNAFHQPVPKLGREMALHAADETTPLLVEAGEESRQLPEQESPDGVNFHPQGDPENPLEWSGYLKWGVVAILASTALSV